MRLLKYVTDGLGDQDNDERLQVYNEIRNRDNPFHILQIQPSDNFRQMVGYGQSKAIPRSEVQFEPRLPGKSVDYRCPVV